MLDRLFSPCLELRGSTSTMGVVTALYPADPFDHAEVSFRGKSIYMTCAHPGIVAGQRVNVIEKPKGVFFATGLQPSWYLRPIAEMISEGRTYQAAMEFIMQGNPRYWPDVIMIDKRGSTTFDDLDTDHDGFISRAEWPYGDASFDAYDTNKDGRISRSEYANAGAPLNWPKENTGLTKYGDPKTFDEYDTDGDGFISNEEWPYDRTSFPVWDQDGDGKVSRAEWKWNGKRLVPYVPTAAESAALPQPADDTFSAQLWKTGTFGAGTILTQSAGPDLGIATGPIDRGLTVYGSPGSVITGFAQEFASPSFSGFWIDEYAPDLQALYLADMALLTPVRLIVADKNGYYISIVPIVPVSIVIPGYPPGYYLHAARG